MKNFRERLRSGAEELGIFLDDSAIERFILYRDELKRWGKVHNLVSSLDDDSILTNHFLDSLLFMKAFPEAAGLRIADVGSGAGFPGLPIAISRPDLAVTLIEPRSKRAAFLHHVTRSLEKKNIDVIERGVESVHGAYDIVTSRAVWEMTEFVRKTKHIIAPGGRWITSKGPKYAEELACMADQRPEIMELRLPGTNVNRWLIILIT